MKIVATPIEGLKVLETSPFVDKRGAFVRMFCARELDSLIGDRKIVQINHSRTNQKGAVRGLHYQNPPHAEMKLVSCLKGRVWDVAVDLRKGSRTFLNWHSVELTPENRRTFLIPEGFAHGFQALERESELLYFHTAFYEPSAESGVQPADPMLGIAWPIDIVDLSERDLGHPLLQADFAGVAV